MEILIIIASLIFSAIFSGSETAFVSANRLKFEVQKRAGKKGITIAYSFLKSPAKYLSTTLVGNNLMIVICSSVLAIYLVGQVNESLIVLISSILILYFAEILPKSIARQIPNRSVRYVAPLLRVFETLLFPLIWLSQIISQGIIYLFGEQKDEVKIFFAKEDLPVLLRESGQDEAIREDQQKLLERVIRIGSLSVRDVMVPRTEMLTIEENEDFQSVQKKFVSSGFSRLPVYRDNLDDIIGVAFVLDQLFAGVQKKATIRPVPFFPETKRALDALQELKKTGSNMAIVVDEYGGTAGLVTIEDLVEELFGQIRDEYDREPSRLFYRLDDKTLLANARAEITQLNDRFDIALPSGDYVTLGGFVLRKFGHIPVRGESLDLPKCKIVVLNATQTKVQWVRIKLKKEEATG